jgi:probable blue pigment (indigoidine) exporter
VGVGLVVLGPAAELDLLGQTLGPVQLVGFALSLAAIAAGQLPARPLHRAPKPA